MRQQVTITRDMNDEYRVPGPDGREATAYYTSDREDAWATARAVYGTNITIRIRKVEVHPQ